MLVCFFFFKQKTAYEMRISDWSSDVCSSDLLGLRTSLRARPAAQVLEDFPCRVAPRQAGDATAGMGARTAQVQARQGAAVVALAQQRPCAEQLEIGRASCRERVCQYV